MRRTRLTDHDSASSTHEWTHRGCDLLEGSDALFGECHARNEIAVPVLAVTGELNREIGGRWFDEMLFDVSVLEAAHNGAAASVQEPV